MPTAAVTGFGAKLKIGDGATPTEVFTAIAEVKNISGPSGKLEVVDVTNQDSAPASGGTVPIRERIATVFDEGEVRISGNFIADHATLTSLRTDQRKGTKRNFQLLFSDPTPQQGAFAAFITELDREHPFDKEASFNATVVVTGPITWT